MGTGLGAGRLGVLHVLIPHMHLAEEAGGDTPVRLSSAYLVATGLILHDFPEGFALANSYIANPEVGVLVAVAGIAVGAVIGSVTGWRQIGKVRGVFIGGGAGIAAGVAGGLLMALPGTFWTIAVGSTLLLLFAVVVRFSSPGARKTPTASGDRRGG